MRTTCWRHIVLAGIVVPMLLMVATVSFAQHSRGYYAGTIGDTLQVAMQIGSGTERINLHDSLSGAYHYARIGREIPLRGAVGSDAVVRLDEYGGRRGEYTGRFEGRLDESEGTFAGVWSDAVKNTRLPFRLRRAIISEYFSRSTLDTESGFSPVRFDIAALYPRFIDRSGNPRVALNRAIRREVNAMLGLEEGDGMIDPVVDPNPDADGSTEDETDDEVVNRVGDGEDTAVCTNEVTMDVRYFSDDILALAVTVDGSGGAHPNHAYGALNYHVQSGAVHPLGAADCFRRGSGYRRELARLVHENLRGRYACSEGVTLRDVLEQSLDAQFIITPHGLLYRLWPGNYVCGNAEEFVVPYTAIRRLIDPHGPLARFIQ